MTTTPDSGAPKPAWTLRMKDLCEGSGMTRQSIHFYIREGLLPAGRKRGKNMAFYGQVHVDRLELIRQLQEERFMPLKAIKALLDGRDSHFTPSQHEWLAHIRKDLPEVLQPDERRSVDVLDATEVTARYDVTTEELRELAAHNFLGLRQTVDGLVQVTSSDLWVVALWSELKAEGFADLGLTISDLVIYERAIAELFHQETALFAKLMSGLPSGEAADRVATGLVLADRFMTSMHRARVQQFFEWPQPDSSQSKDRSPQ